MRTDCYAVRPGRPKGRQAQKTETIAHNSVFAGHREAGCNQRTPTRQTCRVADGHQQSSGNAVRRLWFVERVGPAPAGLLRGYSSVGRAVALQAIGQGFESPYLQSSFFPGWVRAKKNRSPGRVSEKAKLVRPSSRGR
jgi:hypothetical protein